ncbi:MAG: sulfatase-like hydrolase/transferase [Parasporobacterium sp.]|nr:sulfatase-like hydrolase/transferase [Parasporobacterium sp.]
MEEKPNILIIMCDQFRYDCIHALGNRKIYTPYLDRLVREGLSFSNAYSTCPVCMPARYTLRTGCEPYHTGFYGNGTPHVLDGQPEDIHERCGSYLAAAMRERGYYSFGIGKFHCLPFDEDCGYDEQYFTEEGWKDEASSRKDDYFSFMRREHPEYNHIEQLHGERTNMYYVPQMSPFPGELTVEGYVARRAAGILDRVPEDKPYFGFVSFVGPHPPCAPPVPFNRMYDPDQMDDPVGGTIEEDHLDDEIPCMNRHIWADEINDFGARNLKSRYYGEITYIDECIGLLLDKVKSRPDADNTAIFFMSDHGDLLGDHHGWQKETYYEQAARVPMLLSWPGRIKPGISRELITLTDIFGIVTQMAGRRELKDGEPVLDAVLNRSAGRDHIFACYGLPGTRRFKFMIRKGDWKYIYLSNGGREQLFNLADDPTELKNLEKERKDIRDSLREIGRKACLAPGLKDAMDGQELKALPFEAEDMGRLRQFAAYRGVTDFSMK